MLKQRFARLIIGAGLLAAALPAAAQPTEWGDPIVTGLNNPRHIAYGADGTLYVPESGTGGPFVVEGPFGPAQAGATGQVTAVAADGTASVPLAGFPSIAMGAEITGPMAAYPHGDLLWVVTGAAWPGMPLARTVAALDSATLRIVHLIDTFAAEAAQNPDGNEIDSNPVDIVIDDDGNAYIADAGANTIWKWSHAGMMSGDTTLEVFATWPDNPVPTSVALDGEGHLFVGFLMGFPFPTDGSRVEMYTVADGALAETFTGFTSVVDVLAVDGNVFASEIATFGDQGWVPNSGAVVRVTRGGPVPVAEGLNFPFGLALAPAGNLVVTVNSAYGEAGSGAVVPISPEIAGMMPGSLDAVTEAGGEAAATVEPAAPEATPGS